MPFVESGLRSSQKEDFTAHQFHNRRQRLACRELPSEIKRDPLIRCGHAIPEQERDVRKQAVTVFTPRKRTS